MALTIYQVDAFAERPFQGNPAGVCLLAHYPPDEWLQQVAGEMNLSETAFLVPHDGEFRLRWFTPGVEVDLCGHATLASAHVLWETGRLAADREARFHTRSGLLTARLEEGRIEMDFPSEPPAPCEAPPGLLEALGAEARNLGKNRFDYLVEVESPGQVESLDPDLSALRRIECRGVMVTAASPGGEYDFVSRFFAPAAGVNEDPVTGSAHCCLAPYWAERLGRTRLTGYQASRRGGRVSVEVRGDRVLLSGSAVTVLHCRMEAGLPEGVEMESKSSYQERMQKQFDEWSGKIDGLLSRVERKAQGGYQVLAQELGEKREVASRRFSELKESSSEAWQDLKPGVEDAWKDLRQAVEKAASRFRAQ